MIAQSIKKIAVIGAGTMGQGIAQRCAQSGFSVLLYDAQPAQTRSAITQIQKSLEALVAKEKLTSEQHDQTLLNIQAIDDFRQLQVDMVIEAVVEKLEVKQKIFLELEKINGKDCILASNTSSIPITQIASVLKHADRAAGLHFFNPATVMKLVEVIRGAQTSEATVSQLQQFAAEISKTSVLAKDAPGFIVNRVARLFYVESLKIVEENVTDFRAVDNLMKATGFRMGPFELMDLIGLDINYSVTESVYEAFHHDSKFRPSRLQKQKVDAGYLGKKTGKGFYDYPS
jgi:3-hydroxybutyryl-CoA dehydrogenase